MTMPHTTFETTQASIDRSKFEALEAENARLREGFARILALQTTDAKTKDIAREALAQQTKDKP